MSSFNKSKLTKVAIACSLAITAQGVFAAADISGTEYNTFGHNDVDHIVYSGYAGWNADTDGTSGNIYPIINNSVINGVVSTYYLNNSADSSSNTLSISNSTIHGMITSDLLTDTAEHDNSGMFPLNLTVDNSTIDDTFQHYTFDSDVNGIADHDVLDTYDWGNAITLDQEANIVIQNNSHVAGITLTQGYEWPDTTVDSAETFNNNVTIKDSTLTSGAYSELDTTGFYGQSDKPSDYTGHGGADDAALIVMSNGAADNAMINNVSLDHSTMMGDVLFSSEFHENFYPNGNDTNGDGTADTNGWADTDQLNLTLTNGSKWVGAAVSDVQSTQDLIDVAANSITPDSTFDNNGHVNGDNVYQSGIFNIALDNGSEWDTRNASNIDALTLDHASTVNLTNSSLLADSVTLNNASSMNIMDTGSVHTDALNINTGSTVALTEEKAGLYANTITVANGGELDLGKGSVDTHNLILTDNGILNVASRDYALNSDLNNGRYITSDKNVAGYDQGVIAINSDGHLAVNGDTNGNYKVVVTDSTGKGSIADYQNKEIVRVYDNNADTNATFTAGNKADLGAYTYNAQQQGDTVVLAKDRLTDAANIALSVPSANANVWHAEQDTLNARLNATRHTEGDKGGVWANYVGGNFKGDTNTLDYNQDINGIMVGVDKIVEGGNADWLLGMSAGFNKGKIDNRSGQADQDSQSGRIYASTMFKNNVFIDTGLSYSRFSNDLQANMSNGDHTSGNTTSSGWGFNAKVGYDWAVAEQTYLTPYASINGLFADGDNYTMSNGLNVSSQNYDSIRYEAGVDAGHTFNYGAEQSLTPYMTVAYVYDDASNNGTINKDSIDNGVKGSAVRVGAGAQFNFSKNFSTNAGVNYLGGGDVDQPWAATVGVKYNW